VGGAKPDAPWEVLSVTAEDAGVAIEAIESHALQPADAFLYRICRRACGSCIVTNHRHFRGMRELNCIRYGADTQAPYRPSLPPQLGDLPVHLVVEARGLVRVVGDHVVLLGRVGVAVVEFGLAVAAAQVAPPPVTD